MQNRYSTGRQCFDTIKSCRVISKARGQSTADCLWYRREQAQHNRQAKKSGCEPGQRHCTALERLEADSAGQHPLLAALLPMLCSSRGQVPT